MITDEGYCTTCHHRVAEHPDFRCPWCDDANPREVGSPEEVLREIRVTARHLRALKVQRGRMCREALAAGQGRSFAKRLSVSLRLVRAWALAEEKETCARGHNRALNGRLTADGEWECTWCIKERQRTVSPPAPTPSAQRRAWERLESQEEERIRALGERPSRLRPLLPPFGDGEAPRQ